MSLSFCTQRQVAINNPRRTTATIGLLLGLGPMKKTGTGQWCPNHPRVPYPSHTHQYISNVQQTIIPLSSEVQKRNYIRPQQPKKKKKRLEAPLQPLHKSKRKIGNTWKHHLSRLPLDEATPMISSSPSPSPSMTLGRLEGLVTAALTSTSSLSRSSLISAVDTDRFFCCSRVWRRISRRS